MVRVRTIATALLNGLRPPRRQLFVRSDCWLPPVWLCWLLLPGLVCCGLAGCQTTHPQTNCVARDRSTSLPQLQRRETNSQPQFEARGPVNTPPSLAAESVSRAQPGKVQIGDLGRPLRPLVNHAGWSGDEFLKGTRRSWRPTLLIRANDEQAAVSTAGLEAEVGTEAASGPTDQSDWSGLVGEPNSELEAKWQWNLDQRSISDRNRSRWERVKSDYANFYSSKSMLQMGAAFLAGAAMANTNFDEMFSHDLYRDNVIDIANEDISQTLHQPKLLGDGYILLPTLAALALAEPWLEQSEWTKPLGEWGDRGARAILVGGPVVLLTQNLTGSSRPNESPSGSHWEPFQDNNGVSGHAFVGAVPFLTAGRMSRRPWAKALWYGASTLPALSRVNDEGHFFSQAFLGWYLAWLATAAVDNSQQQRQLKLIPTWNEAGPGLMFERNF